MKKIPLHGKYGKGKFAIVDDEDYEFLMQWKWLYVTKGYAARHAKQKTIYMHRVINKTPNGCPTDHIDMDGLNNQKSNLRNATLSQNNSNRKAAVGAVSKYKGVSWHKSQSNWRARIKINYKEMYIGSFYTEDEAARAYNIEAVKQHGEFAYLNVIEGKTS